MKPEAHISVVRTTVREGQLTRHAARAMADGRAFAVSSGLGLPRTWAVSTDAAMDGFAEGLASSPSDSGSTLLQKAFAHARASLAHRCDNLVERVLPDATFAALLLEGTELHVMSVGPGRVYLHRAGRPQRLTAREEERGGLLRVRPTICTTAVDAGDLILAGSVTAFSMSSIAKAMSVLGEDPKTPTSVLSSLLTEPAAQAGAGAATVVLRIR